MRLGETRYDDLAENSKALALAPKSLCEIRTVSSSDHILTVSTELNRIF